MEINVITYVKKDVRRMFVYKQDNVFQVVRFNFGEMNVKPALKIA